MCSDFLAENTERAAVSRQTAVAVVTEFTKFQPEMSYSSQPY